MKYNLLKCANIFLDIQIVIGIMLCCLIVLSVHSIANAKIVFTYNGSIYVMNDDGSGRHRLTDNQYWEGAPRWSPDGTKIAFERNLEKDIQKYQLFIMNADGTNQQQLTHSDEGKKNGAPAWSPDGRHLAFKSNRSGRLEIHVMDLQTLQVTQLTGIEEESGSYTPDWSPDGEEIVYGRFVDRGKTGLSHKNIWIMSADGQNQRPLLPDPVADEKTSVFRDGPLWFPDGKRILIYEDGFDRTIIPQRYVIMSKTGKRIEEIDLDKKIGEQWVSSGESLMDSGRSILFSAKRSDVPEKKQNHDVYRYEIMTGKLKQLTTHRYNDFEPDWVEGPLPVSMQGKLPMQWGDIKIAQFLTTKPILSVSDHFTQFWMILEDIH